ncbi:protein of unknown function [Vibrio tapetis subsp. tapetis]|uniref:Uncharacterized protein n=1 Tax=Vibrio tapetis subsp. tapetis TaxID=1671868 RepID=A0A2N8ZKL6_9VIBR|nr:protein of unknown function [Vibrio tapetis subsp. tapetis]
MVSINLETSTEVNMYLIVLFLILNGNEILHIYLEAYHD